MISVGRPRRRWPAWTAGAAALVLMLAACGGDDDTSAAGDGAELPTPADGPVTITVWVNREQYMPVPSFYEALEAEYPDITVEAELVPDDDLFFQLLRMQQAGEELPDVVQLDDFFAVPMLDSGLEGPLDAVVQQWQEEDAAGFDKVSPNALFTNDEDDSIVGITPVATMDVLYYRSDWLADAGVETPVTSWDGLLDALRAVKESNPDVVPIALPSGSGSGVNWFISMLAASNVEFDGSVPQLSSAEGVYVIEFLQTLVRDELTTIESLAWGDDESRGAYIGGQAAMTYDSVRSVNDLGEALTESGLTYPDQWSTMLAPLAKADGDEPDGRHLLGTRTYHITAETEAPYEAGVVLRTLMSEEQAYEQLGVSNIPLQRAVLESPEFAEAQPYVPEEHVDAILEASQRPADSRFFQVVEILEQVVQDAFQNPDADPQEMADKWQAELDGLPNN